MIDAFQVVFSPGAAWQRLALARPGVLKVLLLSLVPLLLMVSVAEGYALAHWGKKSGEFTAPRPLPEGVVIRYEATSFLLTLPLVFGGAVLLQRIAASSGVSTTYRDCFATVALGLSPVFLARCLDCAPSLNTWICWGVGALLAWRTLYHAVALMLRPDHTKGFGLYLLTTLVLLVLSGLNHFIAVSVLLGDVVLPV
jgi:hypothetical protein